MNVSLIRDLVRNKSGADPAVRTDAASLFEVVAVHKDIREYLTNCVVEEEYIASEMGMAGYQRLVDENLQSAGPGCYIYPYGFIILATSIGGNAICADAATGAVYWADQGQFTEFFITYSEPATGKLKSFSEYSADRIRIAAMKIGDDFETVLRQLLSDELTEFVSKYE